MIAADLDIARTVREAVYRAAAAPPPAPRLHRGMVTLTGTGPDPAASALSAVARDAISLLATSGVGRLRECASPECGLLFVDTSRPGRRRWCSSNACGGKARAAAYRQRRSPVS